MLSLAFKVKTFQKTKLQFNYANRQNTSRTPTMNLIELKEKPISELVSLAASMKLDNLGRNRKQDIIFAILNAHAEGDNDIFGGGVLEILQDGFGFLRSSDSSYLAGPDDIYVSPSQIRRFSTFHLFAPR